MEFNFSQSNKQKTEQRMLNYQPTYHDETLDPLIHEILPDIQQSLKKQLMAQLQAEAQQHFEREYQKIQQQAKQEYELAIHDLQEEGEKLLVQQTEELRKEIQRLKKEKKNKQQAHIKNLQEKYISENFQEVVLQHERIKGIQQELAAEIIMSASEKLEVTKQRRIRQIAVKLQNREQKLKKEREKAIKNEIYQNRSIDEIKKDIQIMKIGIASMKSEYNIKIKKIDTEIKQIKEKNKSLQPKENLNDLRQKLQILQTNKQLQELNNALLNNKTRPQISKLEKNNETFSHLDCSDDLISQPNRCIVKAMRSQALIQEHENSFSQDQDYHSSQQQSQSQENFSNECIAKPPMFSGEESQQNLQTFQSHAPILKFNIASLLRTNWEDPLKKYVDFQSSSHELQNYGKNVAMKNNENDGRQSNKQSSFQQVYHEHLQKLNKATKRRKLSMQTKKAIMRNLTMGKK